MINLEIKEGMVAFGEMSSPKHRVTFYTHNTKFIRPENTLLMTFIKDVLTPEEYKGAWQSTVDLFGKPSTKEFYKKVTEIMGRTPTNAMRLWNRAEFFTKVAPRQKLVDALARRSGGRIKSEIFSQLVFDESLLQQVLDDNLKNILPLVFYFKETPKDLRKGLGKGLWKRLASQSFHRNQLIANALEHRFGPVMHYICASAGEIIPEDGWNMFKGYLLRVEKIRSTLLGSRNFMHTWNQFFNTESYQYAVDKILETTPMKGFNRTCITAAMHTSRVIRDTEQMAERLQEKFDMRKHGLTEIQEIHDKYTDLINQLAYSKDKIGAVDDIHPKHLKFGDYEITLLDSRWLIHQEGVNMRHCVSGYAENVARGEYLVYSLTRNGERLSTLGLTKGRRYRTLMEDALEMFPQDVDERVLQLEFKMIPLWDYQQHYGFANGRGQGQAFIGGGIQSMFQVFLVDLLVARLNDTDFLTEDEVAELEFHYNRMVAGDWTLQDISNFPVDRLKLNPYNPATYQSVCDSRFRKMVQYAPDIEARFAL